MGLFHSTHSLRSTHELLNKGEQAQSRRARSKGDVHGDGMGHFCLGRETALRSVMGAHSLTDKGKDKDKDTDPPCSVFALVISSCEVLASIPSYLSGASALQWQRAQQEGIATDSPADSFEGLPVSRRGKKDIPSDDGSWRENCIYGVLLSDNVISPSSGRKHLIYTVYTIDRSFITIALSQPWSYTSYHQHDLPTIPKQDLTRLFLLKRSKRPGSDHESSYQGQTSSGAENAYFHLDSEIVAPALQTIKTPASHHSES